MRPSRAAIAAVVALCVLALLASSRATAQGDVLGDAPRRGRRAPRAAEPALYTYHVVKSYPHDAKCFTQGLVYAGGNTLYESAGQYGASDVREVDLESGAVRLRTPVAANVFAEGLALVGGTLLQLTWRSGAGLKYDAKTLAPAGAFTTPLPDGWGLTNGAAPDELLATDGSATLYTLDARTLALKRRVEVTHAGAPVALLNELEFVEGEVFANVWLTDCIARIDPATGAVTGWVLLQGLRPADARGGDDVLNGIAWDAARRRLFVTGKYWRRLFQIELRRLEAGRLSAAHREAAASCTRRHAGLFF